MPEAGDGCGSPPHNQGSHRELPGLATTHASEDDRQVGPLLRPGQPILKCCADASEGEPGVGLTTHASEGEPGVGLITHASEGTLRMLVVASSPKGKTWPLIVDEVCHEVSARYRVPADGIDITFCMATAQDARYLGRFPQDVALGEVFDVIVFAGLCNTEKIPLLESLVPRLAPRKDTPSSVLFIEGKTWTGHHVARNAYLNLFSDARALKQLTPVNWTASGDMHYMSVSPWLYAFEVCVEGGDNYCNVAPFAATTSEFAQGNLLFYDLTPNCASLLRSRVAAAQSDGALDVDTVPTLGIDAGRIQTFTPLITSMLLQLHQHYRLQASHGSSHQAAIPEHEPPSTDQPPGPEPADNAPPLTRWVGEPRAWRSGPWGGPHWDIVSLG